MKSTQPLLAVALLAAATLVASCSDESAGSNSTAPDGAGGTDFGLPRGDEPVTLDPADFTVDIDNPYWPMAPGDQWRYSETDEQGSQLEVVVTVTSETKDTATGVTARVVRDTVTRDGTLIEDTFDWYAQDAEGNLWYLGEDTAEFDHGAISSTSGSFEAGVDGALPGIMVPAHPTDGMAYRQEYYRDEAEDNGEVLSTEEQAEVPAGHYDDVLLTKDTITIEPDVVEYKLYAPEIGPVLVLGVSGGGGREQLVEHARVDRATATAAGTTPLGESYS